uniref:carbonic anhydrase n=1 Tax=Steinernema glaseri TaxID=37863 RepID=A0A1I7Z3U8_9BILA
MTAHWNYDSDEEHGPHNWPGEIHGSCQSPVDICHDALKKVSKAADPLKFVNYNRAIHGDLVNNGHAVQFVPDRRIDTPEIYGGSLDQSYKLVQYHLHWSQGDDGSEHTLNGEHKVAELHLVHAGVEDPERLVVLGVFLEVGPNHKPLEPEFKTLPHVFEPNTRRPVENIVLEDKLPKDLSYVRYHGSLTTPPCSECVTWFVFTQPISITEEQLAALRQVKDSECGVLKKNRRPVQPLNGRELFHVC